jgi:hypothetical protein
VPRGFGRGGDGDDHERARLKPYEVAAAKERQVAGQKAGGKTAGRGRKAAQHPAKKAGSKGESRNRAAQATGYSASTLAHVAEIEEAAQTDLGIYDDLLDELNTAKKGEVNGIYRAFVKRRKQRALSAAQAQVTEARLVQLDAVCDLRVCSCVSLFGRRAVPVGG